MRSDCGFEGPVEPPDPGGRAEDLRATPGGPSPIAKPHHSASMARTLEQNVRLIQSVRQRRARLFGAELFADPAWDMLLELFLRDLRQRPISVAGLCIASRVPATTAQRWMDKLESEGWLRRSADPSDRGRLLICLTDGGRSRMERLADLDDFSPGMKPS